MVAAKIRMGKGGVERHAQAESRQRLLVQTENLPVRMSSSKLPGSAIAGANPAPSPRYRSKLEARWANYLDGLKALKLIDDWRYEPMNFRLPGKRNFYKVDFLAWTGRAVTFFEVKGRNKSDDRSLVKLKTATGLHPWAVWIQVQWVQGEWRERVMS